jgi:hypothetical protein
MKISAAAAMDNVKGWKMALAALGRFDGQMNEKSKTWNGLMSTFKQSITSAMIAWGKPLIDQLGPVLAFVTRAVIAIAPRIATAGKFFAGAITTAINFMVGVFNDPQAFVSGVKMMIDEIAKIDMGELLRPGLQKFGTIIYDSLPVSLKRLLSLTKGGLDATFGTGTQDPKYAVVPALPPPTLRRDAPPALPPPELYPTGKPKFKNPFAALIQSGSDRIRSVPDEKKQDPKAPAKGFDRFGNFESSGVIGKSILTSGGLRPATMATGFHTSPGEPGTRFGAINGPGLGGGAYGQTALIPESERRAADSAKYAALAGEEFARTGKFTSARPNGAVRNGDRAAARAFAQNKLRENSGVEKTNALVSAFIKKFDNVFNP